MIREFEFSDGDRCREIISECIRGYTSLNEEEKKFFKKLYTEDGYLEKKAKLGKIFVIELNKKIVGMGMIEKDWAKKLFIDPKYHNKGFGSLLFNKLETEIKNVGYGAVHVLCFPNTIEYCKHRGYSLVQDSIVVRKGVEIRVTHMVKKLK